MQPYYTQYFEINDLTVDRFGRMKPSAMLYTIQEAAGGHCNELQLDYDRLSQRNLFWAVIRHRLQVTRLPKRGETNRVETWPLPTTRAAFPRSVVAYDEEGNECFRAISLWVLMDKNTRNMILPGKSGIMVPGQIRGNELPAPGSLVPGNLLHHESRVIRFTDLDRNGHMNNTRYLDWISDLLPSSFHESHTVKDFTICYHAEGMEGQDLDIAWEVSPEGFLNVDASHSREEEQHRTFSARLEYEDVL